MDGELRFPALQEVGAGSGLGQTDVARQVEVLYAQRLVGGVLSRAGHPANGAVANHERGVLWAEEAGAERRRAEGAERADADEVRQRRVVAAEFLRRQRAE